MTMTEPTFQEKNKAWVKAQVEKTLRQGWRRDAYEDDAELRAALEVGEPAEPAPDVTPASKLKGKHTRIANKASSAAQLAQGAASRLRADAQAFRDAQREYQQLPWAERQDTEPPEWVDGDYMGAVGDVLNESQINYDNPEIKKWASKRFSSQADALDALADVVAIAGEQAQVAATKEARQSMVGTGAIVGQPGATSSTTADTAEALAEELGELQHSSNPFSPANEARRAELTQQLEALEPQIDVDDPGIHLDTRATHGPY